MESIKKILKTYQEIISEAHIKQNKVKKQIYHIGSIRLILFVIGISGIIYFRSADWYIITLIILTTLLPFLILIKKHNKLFYKKEYLDKKLEVNKQELDALNYNISSFDSGDEYINSSHLYTYDLDIFGEHSLFQYINRSSTIMGRKKLAQWFNAHLENKNEINERQEAIREIAPEIKFRQRFRVLGLLYKGEKADEQELKEWVEHPGYFFNKPIIRILPSIIFLINLISITLAVLALIPFSLSGVIFICCALFSFIFSKKITKIQSIYGRKLEILGTYAKLIELIEKKEVRTPYLKRIKKQVGENKDAASQSVKELSALMHALDQRNNILVALILNGFIFWELKQMMRIEAWKDKYAKGLPQWLEAIAQIDALCSLATYAYNHPDYIYPEITDNPFQVEAKSLGHPLMRRDKCIRNDVKIQKQSDFIIITGANMAGKSTYLRTIGINYLLACLGAPVFASQMTLYPAKLITSLRTTDSLNNNESYFFAELKRLKSIIDKLHAGEELFIILDEILKGTNSKDKQKGSFALISQLVKLKSNGIIATHDLLLGTLVEHYPNNIRNFCFEADITNDELQFSYQLKEGIAQNMNACFLMKKMGIAVIDDLPNNRS